MSKKIVFNGIEYGSITEISKVFGKNPANVQRRLRDGWSIEDALMKDENLGQSIIVNGVEYNSVREACRELNLNISTVQGRLNRGLTVDEAFSIDSKKVIISGVEYKSLIEACRERGIPKHLIYSRLKRGISLEEAFSMGQQSERVFKYNGVVYGSKSEAYRVLGVSKSTVTKKLREGFSFEDILAMEKGHKPVVVNGIEYPSISEACRQIGVSRFKVKERLKRGHSLEVAFLKDDLPKPGCREVMVEGILYNSIRDACSYYNIKPSLVNSRLQSGFSIESAIGAIPPESNGVISRSIWNREIVGVYIVSILNGGEFYKCLVGNSVKYYSKDEMVVKWKKTKGTASNNKVE